MSADQPGFYRGQHYSAHVDQVRALKRAGDIAGTERLLLALVESFASSS